MGRVISYSAVFVLLHSTVAVGESITEPCRSSGTSFFGTPGEIEVSNADSLGSNVCINQADTSPSFTGLWHFIFCPGANNFRNISSDEGGAKFCQGYNGRPGIGIDFPSGEATVKQLQLVCERQIGTTLNVIDITVYFRRKGFIGYVNVSGDGNVAVSVSETKIIAKFVGLEEDLATIMPPDGVTCKTTPEADNCRLIGGGSEMTMTCTVTPQGETDSGEKVFSGPNGTLATVTVNVNAMGSLPTPTEDPTNLGTDNVIGLAVSIPTFIAVLLVLFIAIITFFFIVWRVGPPPPESRPTQGDVESGDGRPPPPPPPPYVAFGEGIHQEVKSSVVNHFNPEEFRLNGSSVEDRFGHSNERILFVTTPDEYEATTPSGARDSSLVAQMRQLEKTQSDRIVIVKLPDWALRSAGQQDANGESPVISIINDHLTQQPAPDLQPALSNMDSIRAWLQSIHKMVFQLRTQGPPSVPNHTAEEGNGHCPRNEDGELHNRQPPRDEDDNEDRELP